MPSDIMSRRDSVSRRCFWYCSGLMAVSALKWWWKVDRLMPDSRASVSTRSGSAKRALRLAMARATWWLWVSTVAIWRSRAPASPTIRR
ncbi:hypothetical protein D9M69_598850 [compost metagenome]